MEATLHRDTTYWVYYRYDSINNWTDLNKKQSTEMRNPYSKITEYRKHKWLPRFIGLLRHSAMTRGGLILQSTADVQGRRRLRSASTSTLVVPPTRRATIGDRAFPAAALRAWNSLPTSIREIQSLPAFRRKSKTALFAISFPAD